MGTGPGVWLCIVTPLPRRGSSTLGGPRLTPAGVQEGGGPSPDCTGLPALRDPCSLSGKLRTLSLEAAAAEARGHRALQGGAGVPGGSPGQCGRHWPAPRLQPWTPALPSASRGTLFWQERQGRLWGILCLQGGPFRAAFLGRGVSLPLSGPGGRQEVQEVILTESVSLFPLLGSGFSKCDSPWGSSPTFVEDTSGRHGRCPPLTPRGGHSPEPNIPA